MTAQYGLIGFPLSHSLSAKLFQEQFHGRYSYELFPLENLDSLHDWIFSLPFLKGFNVTHPYKENIIPYIDELDEVAKKIGAVNTVTIDRKEQRIILKGYNTDFYGFRKSLQHLHPEGNVAALILGTGGAAKAVAHALSVENIPHLFVSRTAQAGAITYQELSANLLKEKKLIINATPLGMHPLNAAKPDIPYQAIDSSHYLFDLIYNPPETLFLLEGKKREAHTQNGIGMLRYQAEASWKIWKLIQ